MTKPYWIPWVVLAGSWLCPVSLTWAQKQGGSAYQVPLPPGMPKLPPGMVPAPVPARRLVVQRVTTGMKQEAKGSEKGEGTPSRSRGATFDLSGDVAAFAVVGGPKPIYHVVRPGDTLWDICAAYFQDPWKWPQIWALNPQITNPHWIYPGDRIRLRPDHSTAAPKASKPTSFGEIQIHQQRGPGQIWLRKTAFVAEKRLPRLSKVTGAATEKILLSNGDVVYVRVSPQNPLKVGETYSVFHVTRTIRHPLNGRKLGKMVEVAADVTITAIKWHRKKGIAEGTLSRSVAPVERGFLVGKLRRRFQALQPAPEGKGPRREALVAAILGPEQVVGTDKLVVLDKGRKEGLKPGMVLHVIRRGDQYRRTMEMENKPGPKSWPDYEIGLLVVVDAGEHHAIAVVADTRKEIHVGEIAWFKLQGTSAPKASAH